MNRRLLDYTPEMEFLDEAESPADAAQEGQTTAFGADLLEVADEAGLEDFLTELVAAVTAAERTPVAAALGKALVAELKRAARPLLPIRSNGAGAGGADLKTRAARLFAMELEGLSPEDKEFEVAQQFIRLGADTIRNAAATARAGAPQAVAAAALRQAARRYAPGLLQRQAQASPPGGRWRREGRRIVVFNC
jgi:hypothetical protein